MGPHGTIRARMSNRPKKNKKLNMPLLGELSRSSLELFESNGKVDQIQGRLASFVQKWRFQVLVFFSNVESAPPKNKKLNMPLLGELSRSSLDSFESNGKVDQIQGRSASFVPKWRFQVLVRGLERELISRPGENTPGWS